MFKFRSMYVDASERQAGLEASNEASGPLFKIKDDPRVTRVGRILRRYSLDELPQILNVLRGEMSLVGPRPLPLRDYVQLEDWHRKRYLVLPGMTGLWQVSGRIDLTLRRSRAARLLLPRELVDLARHLDPREDAARGRGAGAGAYLTVPSDCDRHNGPREGPEDPRGRLHHRPRLPVRRHARVVAAVEGDGGGGHRPDRDAVPRPGGRVALVAHCAEPALPRGRGLRRAASRRRRGSRATGICAGPSRIPRTRPPTSCCAE